MLQIGGFSNIYTQAITPIVWTTLAWKASKLWHLIVETEKLLDDLELFKHLRVYALADMFFIEDLKTTSLDKFQRQISEGWDRDLFLACVWEVYQSAPEYPRTIRPALVDIAVVHAHDLVVKEDFKDLIRKGGDFVVEYAGRLLQVQTL